VKPKFGNKYSGF